MRKLGILTLTALALSGCGETTPKVISDLNPSIKNVSSYEVAGQQLLEINIEPSTTYSNSAYFFTASRDINKLLPQIFKHFPEEKSDQIVFTLSTDLTDSFGNKKTFKVIQLAFNTADVQKVNYSNPQFTSWSLLGHVTNVEFLHPEGRSILRDYCLDEDNAKSAALFCSSYAGT
ncbi:hypothetical protein [Pseudomonas lini]